MKRILAAAFGVLALAAAMPASAADLPPRSAYKAPAYLPAAYNWTGFYLGINAGGGFGNSGWNGFGVSNSPSGGMVGGTVGYNWQGPGTPFVFGVEGDIDATFMNDNVVCGGTFCQTRNNWLGTARGRAGYSFDRFLPYVTGGVAFGDIQARRAGFTGASDTNAGWTIGAGLEGVVAGPWTAKVEYLYVDLGNITCSAVACGVPTNVNFTTNVLRGGVNYRF